jgi:hypothetical protein
MELLKLVAFDQEDLAVLSAHLQDAVIRTGDLTFLAEQHRFALVARRFEWESPQAEPRRRLCGMHFERVLRVRTRNIERDQPDEVLNLLAVTFDQAEAPAGLLTLVFAGDKAVQLDLECLEAQMKDLGPVWAAGDRPSHDAAERLP